MHACQAHDFGSEWMIGKVDQEVLGMCSCQTDFVQIHEETNAQQLALGGEWPVRLPLSHFLHESQSPLEVAGVARLSRVIEKVGRLGRGGSRSEVTFSGLVGRGSVLG